MTDDAEIAAFALRGIPELHFGPGRVSAIAGDAAALGAKGRVVALVVDPALAEMGVAGRIAGWLRDAGADVVQFADFDGEPSADKVESASALVARSEAGLVIGVGGGSAMDLAKLAAAIAGTDVGPVAFAMGCKALPERPLRLICVPTTAGTGSELSSTSVFTHPNGRKVWVWGRGTKPDRVLLDPEPTLTLPSHLTAWTGIDAFAHALEAPCSTALPHNISHALAALGPVHHGLATGLALEVVLGWRVAADDGSFAAAAAACGLGRDALAPVDWYSALLTACGVERKLPAGFNGVGATALVTEMRAPETQDMRRSTARKVSDANIDHFAAAVMALA